MSRTKKVLSFIAVSAAAGAVFIYSNRSSIDPKSDPALDAPTQAQSKEERQDSQSVTASPPAAIQAKPLASAFGNTARARELAELLVERQAALSSSDPEISKQWYEKFNAIQVDDPAVHEAAREALERLPAEYVEESKLLRQLLPVSLPDEATVISMGERAAEARELSSARTDLSTYLSAETDKTRRHQMILRAWENARSEEVRAEIRRQVLAIDPHLADALTSH